MKRKIVDFLKKMVGAFMILYLCNYLLSFLHVVVPINIFTLFGVYFLGFPGLISFIILFYIVK